MRRVSFVDVFFKAVGLPSVGLFILENKDMIAQKLAEKQIPFEAYMLRDEDGVPTEVTDTEIRKLFEEYCAVHLSVSSLMLTEIVARPEGAALTASISKEDEHGTPVGEFVFCSEFLGSGEPPLIPGDERENLSLIGTEAEAIFRKIISQVTKGDTEAFSFDIPDAEDGDMNAEPDQESLSRMKYVLSRISEGILYIFAPLAEAQDKTPVTFDIRDMKGREWRIRLGLAEELKKSCVTPENQAGD